MALVVVFNPDPSARGFHKTAQPIPRVVDEPSSNLTPHSTCSTNPNPINDGFAGYCAWFRLVIKAQHLALLQSEHNRRAAREAAEANATRITRLEELVLALAVKSEEPPCRTRFEDGELDLQKFHTSDGPKFLGPTMVVEPFVKWVSGVQIFFTTKNIIRASHTIKIIGGLIDDSNLLKFYANEASDYLTGPWEAFKTRMFQVALPLNWRMELRKKIHQISMLPTESFMAYSTRARTLQTLANFDATEAIKITDSDLAQFIVFGLAQDLQDRVAENQIMEKSPFKYSYFEQRVNACVTAARSAPTMSFHPRPLPATSLTSKDDFIWRVHAWLDSKGKCHFCKKTCGNAAGACPGPIDKKFIPIPDSFITPPNPPNYTPPRAWTYSQAQPGRPTQPPAGRPSTQAATVAGVSEANQEELAALAAVQEELVRDGLFSYTTEDLEGCYGRLDSASVAAYGDIDTQRWANEEEKYVHSPPKHPSACHQPPFRQNSQKRRFTTGHAKMPSTGPRLPTVFPDSSSNPPNSTPWRTSTQNSINTATPPYTGPRVRAGYALHWTGTGTGRDGRYGYGQG
ncbi:hypothetical protein PSTT_09455 [Puccinia striiformis]|uniref:Retrotransposon gag domain-containing protein n=1 Tax=Puccinia striiformis TaxID=27350 RepID=A0A2S4V881_9BASI|nr:hypothetical protein PSTT_09455 [Puccinia striiformis]